jgi:hypothetical protein
VYPGLTFRRYYEADVAVTAGAAGATAAFVFDAPDRFAETAFFAGADFFATFAVAAFFAAFRTLAQRAFWAAAILARAPALKVRFFLLFAGNSTAGAFFAVDAAEVPGAAFFAACLDFAQRALWAAAILARASVLNVRFVLALQGKLVLTGRLDFPLSVERAPANSAFTCCRLEISASIWATTSCMFMSPPVLRITHQVKSNSAPFYRFLSIAVS